MGRSFYDFQIEMGFKEANDVFQYDEVTEKMRNQFIFLVEETIAEYYVPSGEAFWEKILQKVNIAFGTNARTSVFFSKKVHKELVNYNNHESLYFFEIVVDALINEHPIYVEDFNRFINRLNKLFLENSFGYEFVQGHLIRIDRKFVHQEIVINAIELLHEVEFETASNEFMQAFANYKNGNLKDAITNAGKAFESTMKIICDEMTYSYRQSDTAKKLISTLMDKGFVPSYLQTHFSGVVNTLESGLPTVRNKHSHGDGAIEVEVTDKIVRYALNLCATNIVLLVEIYNERIN